MSCCRKRKRRPVVVCVPTARRRRRVAPVGGAIINQSQQVSGGISGILNPTIQVPINLGDATTLSGKGNTVTNIL